MNPQFKSGDRVQVRKDPYNQDWARRYALEGVLEISSFDGTCYYFAGRDWKALPERLEYTKEEGPW